MVIKLFLTNNRPIYNELHFNDSYSGLSHYTKLHSKSITMIRNSLEEISNSKEIYLCDNLPHENEETIP